MNSTTTNSTSSGTSSIPVVKETERSTAMETAGFFEMKSDGAKGRIHPGTSARYMDHQSRIAFSHKMEYIYAGYKENRRVSFRVIDQDCNSNKRSSSWPAIRSTAIMDGDVFGGNQGPIARSSYIISSADKSHGSKRQTQDSSDHHESVLNNEAMESDQGQIARSSNTNACAEYMSHGSKRPTQDSYGDNARVAKRKRQQTTASVDGRRFKRSRPSKPTGHDCHSRNNDLTIVVGNTPIIRAMLQSRSVTEKSSSLDPLRNSSTKVTGGRISQSTESRRQSSNETSQIEAARRAAKLARSLEDGVVFHEQNIIMKDYEHCNPMSFAYGKDYDCSSPMFEKDTKQAEVDGEDRGTSTIATSASFDFEELNASFIAVETLSGTSNSIDGSSIGEQLQAPKMTRSKSPQRADEEASIKRAEGSMKSKAATRSMTCSAALLADCSTNYADYEVVFTSMNETPGTSTKYGSKFSSGSEMDDIGVKPAVGSRAKRSHSGCSNDDVIPANYLQAKTSKEQDPNGVVEQQSLMVDGFEAEMDVAEERIEDYESVGILVNAGNLDDGFQYVDDAEMTGE